MTLRLLDAGLYTLLVDFGRPAARSLGVPVGGAADRASLALGNALVGNPPDAPALECSLSGPTVVADGPLAFVVYGAPFELSTDRGRLRAGKTFTLEAGEELTIAGTHVGARAYLCIRGGLDGPVVLGSRSSLEPLQAGAELPCKPGRIHGRFLPPIFPIEDGPVTLRVLPGPQADWFPAGELERRTYSVLPASNRMGVRLDGEPLPVPARELISEPVCPGTVQVTRDGRCVILGIDGQTIGGYPKVAQVISADLDRVGQLRAGQTVRFLDVDLELAQRLYRARQTDLREWVVRLGATETFAPQRY